MNGPGRQVPAQVGRATDFTRYLRKLREESAKIRILRLHQLLVSSLIVHFSFSEYEEASGCGRARTAETGHRD